MAERTRIAWTDRTHNEWWGCSSPAGAGCLRCFAAALDRRTGGHHFGPGTRPRLTKEENRNKPYKWNKQAQAAGQRLRVFCGSMMDFFDKHAPPGARDALWGKIHQTTFLDWQLLTKRTANIARMLPPDWGNGYDNVWLGATCEDRKSGLRRVDQLREIPARIRFLSVEPLLEDLGNIDLSGIQWVVVGGESGGGFRRMEYAWVERVIAQCREQDVAVFFKQWGGTAANAGGCLIDGVEIKEWPQAASVALPPPHKTNPDRMAAGVGTTVSEGQGACR